MADKKPTSYYYRNFKGINAKVSKYTTEETEFLDLRNVDFEVPNALQKRPGFTATNTSAVGSKVTGIWEYEQLDGSSWMVVAGRITMSYLFGSSLVYVSDGLGAVDTPKDTLTFFNRFWIADGQRFLTWDGGVSYGIYRAGLICPATSIDNRGPTFPGAGIGATAFLVGGATMLTSFDMSGNETFVARGIYIAYSYLRTDGFQGPVDFLSYARNTVRIGGLGLSLSYGSEFFTLPVNQGLYGMSVPPFQGITAVNIWIATDTATQASDREAIPGIFNEPRTGDLGWVFQDAGIEWLSYTLKPSADLTKFRLFTSIPVANLHTGPVNYSLYGSSIGYGVTFWPSPYGGPPVIGPPLSVSFGFWNNYQNLTPFSGMPFCWYNTNTPKYIDVNQNVMFLSGFSQTPSTIWFSEVGEPETFEPENNFEVRTNDGDRIIGHRTYNGNVIVFKTTSFHKVIGSTPEDFQLVELSLEFGCVSNQAIVEFNEKLVFLDRKGVVLYDGASWRIISTSVEHIFESMNLNQAYENAVAIHHHYRNQIWFSIPTGSSVVNDVTVVWDYLIDAWTFFDGFSPTAFAWAKRQLDKPTVWFGTTTGFVRYFGESFLSDNGTAFTCLVSSRFEQFQGENSTNVWRRLFLDVAPASGLTGTINGRVFTDYNQTTVRATFAMYQTIFQNKAEMGVVGKAIAFEASHRSASLPFLMNGYTWAKRYLRNV